MQRIKKLIVNNLGLKILAVIFAASIWLIVMNTEDPERTQSYEIAVSVENQDYLTDLGKTYEIDEDDAYITILVTAKRSILEELSESDFTAVANLANISEDMTQVPITVTASRYSSQIEITKRTSVLNITVENLSSGQYEITAVTSGDPADNCYVNEIRISPEKVTVSGPESVINQIATAQVTVDVDGAEESIATNGQIVLLDSDGEEISQDRLTLNRTVAAIDVDILMSGEAQLEFVTTGTPADGSRLIGVTCDVTSVALSGTASGVEAIDTIEIDSDLLDISGASESFTVTVRISDFLPDGVSLADSETDRIQVTVEIESQITETYKVPVSNITVENLASGLEIEFVNDTISVVLTGYEEDLADISEDDITGTMDASSLEAGSQTVTIDIDDSYTVSGTVKTVVTVSETSDETESDSTAEDEE